MLKNFSHLGVLQLSAVGITVLGSSPVVAQTWLHCAPLVPMLPGLSAPQALQQQTNGVLRLSANEAQKDKENYFLQGNVISRQYNQELLSESLEYNATTGVAHAQGNIRYQQDGQILTGNNGEFQLDENSGRITPAKFWMTESHLRGDAEQLELQGPNITALTGVRFTTCDEDSNAWYLKASSLVLDKESGFGVARNARIDVMHVPVFYFPYFTFPIDDRRKSGFLLPSLVIDSLAGIEVAAPYYWNIAPQRDATITPNIITKRGLLLDTEFRYLNARSAGQVDLGYINDDSLFGDDRSLLEYRHQGEPAAGWRTNLEYRYGSDKNFLTDFSNDLGSSTISYLERRADVTYSNTAWQGSLLLQNYQTVDQSIAPTSRPYQRLPQLLLTLNEREASSGVHYSMQGELVRFDRDQGVTGSRVDFQPQVSWPWRGDAGFLVPTLKYRVTQYQLQHSDPTVSSSPSRSLPLFSIDGGLFFERDLNANSKARRQTLEPRLYYLQVPYRQQDTLVVDENSNPQVFDSSLSGFGFGQLFRDNRFNGADRVGDARQLSMAVTTRFLDEGGRDLLNASLGRSFYFQDRIVTLPGGSVETRPSSDWIAEMNSQWGSALSARASLLWDTRSNEAATGTLDLRYSIDQSRTLRFAYRYQRDTQKQIDLAGIWPVASHWNLVGRMLHSVLHDVTLETLAGLEYESCCWNLRMVHRRSRVDINDVEPSNSIWLQLELKGFTSVGKKVKDLLARDILAL